MVTCASRLSPEKGLEYALGAFALLRAYLPSARLDLWGDGDDRERLGVLIRLLGLKDSVCLRGTYTPGDEVERVASGTTVFLFPSLIEGLPVTLMEMASRGVPIVAAASGGATEVLGHKYPWLVPIADTRATADALRELIVDSAVWSDAAARVLEAGGRFVVRPGRRSPVLEHLRSVGVRARVR